MKRRLWAWIGNTYAVSLLGLLVMPMVLIVPMSFSNTTYLIFPPQGFSLRAYEQVFFNETWIQAGILSVQLGLSTVVSATVLGSLAALGLDRLRFPGKDLLRWWILSPMIIPIMVIAIGIYYVWAQFHLVNTFAGLLIAHTVLALPFVTVSVLAVLQGLDRRLELAALSLGANRWNVLRFVTLPLIWPGIATGGLFAFVISFDELVLALFLTGPDTITLPIKLWDGIRYQVDPAVAAVATLMMVMEIVAYLGVKLVQARNKARDG